MNEPASTAPPSDTSGSELDKVLSSAASASPGLRASAPRERSAWLRAVAERLEARRADLVEVAQDETHLGEDRLAGEVTRTAFQLRLFAEVLEDGDCFGLVVDPPRALWPPGPRPDLRRMLVALGPVLVFSASNFPFAFSVAGGDTASALAAGCPVVLKAHPGHPRLSGLTATVVGGALDDAGAPPGSFSLIYGEQAARAALADPRIAAGAFTGSLRAGRALFDLACARAVPIPFYAEMGSLNPVFVTPTALARRGAQICDGLVASFTLGAGQFCTKPGVVAVPEGGGFCEQVVERLSGDEVAQRLLNGHTARGYAAGLAELRSHPAVEVLVEGTSGGLEVSPSVLRVTAADLRAHREELMVECFGPVTVLATYTGDDQLLASAAAFDGQLTATIHGEEDDAVVAGLLDVLSARAGRVIWNGWPTGVSVTWAMQHGGPYPATTSALHTSVGTTAIARFLRPLSYQSVPASLLPGMLRDDNPFDLPRRIDGRWQDGRWHDGGTSGDREA